MGPGPPPLGCLPGGPWDQCLRPRNGRALLVLASFFMTILTSIFDRLGVDLGSVLGWGSFSIILAPWSAKVGPKVVFGPS